MKPINNAKSSPRIKLGKTFFNIATGAVSASDVAAKKKAEKEAARAEAQRQGKRVERTDPFLSNFGQ